MDYTSIKVGQLPTDEISGGNFIAHEVAGLLKKATINDLVAFIGASDAIGFRAVSVPNGGTLPSTDTQEFILVGPGTYNNVGGGSTITVTEELNALVSNGTYWFVGVEIPIDAPPGNAVWGQIVGTLSNQTDLKALLDVKADLVAGKVPASQLPSYVDDVLEFANLAAFPATGETGKIYIALDNNKVYRWSGTAYIEVAANSGVWGAITGTLSNQTDLQNALNAKVPYTGATGNVDLGTHTLLAKDLVINHSSGSGVAVSITKGGSGEALTVVKSSGSGNAASITGGKTLISELNLTTSLADTYIASAANWNEAYGLRHAAVTLGTANGLSLIGQQLSLGLASSSQNGALSSTDWNTFNNKQNALGYTAANDANVVKLTGNQTITGIKTFNDGLQSIGTNSIGFTAITGGAKIAYLPNTIKLTDIQYGGSLTLDLRPLGLNTGVDRYISFPNKNGIVAMTSDIPTNPITGTGDTNFLPKFTSSSALGNSVLQELYGVIGLGVTPKNWSSAYKVLQISDGALTGTIDNCSISHNLWQNGETPTYITSRAATLYEQNSGNHYWYTAPSGTANNAMTLTPRMILTNDGKLGIGTTSPNFLIHSNGSGSNSYMQFTSATTGTTSSDGLIIGTGDAGDAFFLNRENTTMQFYTNNTERMRITSGGSVIVNNLGTGLVYSNGGALTSTNPSDERLKDDITDLQYGLNEILQLRPVSYNWKNDTINQGKQFGFIAQEVQEIMPDLVKKFETKDGDDEVVRLGLDKEAIYVAMVNAIKELKAEINVLKN